jgi:methionyl-tRNA formyltransferase
MNTILLTRNSEFQIYCANYLWKRGLISAVLVEDGNSFRKETSWFDLSSLSNIFNFKRIYFKKIFKITENIHLYFNKSKYFGNQKFHNERILKEDYTDFLSEMPIVRIPNINSEEVKIILKELSPELVLVFGTRLINSSIFENCTSSFINMHWGWSPDFRGEGIISALANAGSKALGVTIHSLSSKIDGGDIYFQARPTVDEQDNFYSIGLKLTLLGTELFVECIQFFAKGELRGSSQDLTNGKLYSSRFFRDNPVIYRRAWKNLKAKN